MTGAQAQDLSCDRFTLTPDPDGFDVWHDGAEIAWVRTVNGVTSFGFGDLSSSSTEALNEQSALGAIKFAVDFLGFTAKTDTES